MSRYDQDKNQDTNEPFNDAVDHLTKVEGYPTSRTRFSQLPKGIRYIGYFFLGLVVLSFLLGFISTLLD